MAALPVRKPMNIASILCINIFDRIGYSYTFNSSEFCWNK
jgi:hypothetical protein